MIQNLRTKIRNGEPNYSPHGASPPQSRPIPLTWMRSAGAPVGRNPHIAAQPSPRVPAHQPPAPSRIRGSGGGEIPTAPRLRQLSFPPRSKRCQMGRSARTTKSGTALGSASWWSPEAGGRGFPVLSASPWPQPHAAAQQPRLGSLLAESLKTAPFLTARDSGLKVTAF